MKLAKSLVAVAALAGAFSQPAAAGESPFGWIYTADVQPPGTRQFQQWVDVQTKQTLGDYTNVRLRSEMEFGITSKYQTGIYLNSRYINAYQNQMDGTTAGPNTDIPDNFDPTSRYKLSRFESVSWENVYQISNPLVDPIGLALYVEPTWGPRNKELEFKLILQKNFFDDRLIWATNLVTALENNKRGSRVEKATEVDFLTGLSYRFTNNWSAGFEARNHREFTGYGYGVANHSAWFLGPNLHYATKNWWVTVAWRQQLPLASGFQDDQKAVISNSRIYGDEHTRNQFMLKVGVPF
ncbi:hypothetical protein D9M73_59810 [compost metagenome]|uniref:DUF6662 family protein n=1 Tax=Polaromonas aquatica TaxID=332657 RepID=A0ABW1TTA8_9BURK|nr:MULTISPECIES: DUF6662 family protein [unclassified Polaromonas]HQR96960.1 hypothetical protein [Polaromonas sp.]HQS39136.1 hypothetical protein [Polaromonas sp.]